MSALPSTLRTQRPRLQPLLMALRLAMTLAAAGTCLPAAFAQSTAPSARYDIPAGPLEESLRLFSQQAAVAIVIDSTKVKGLQSPALKGLYSVTSGFQTLLQNTGYSAVQTNAGYVLQAVPPGRATDATERTLPALTVQGQAPSLPQREGSAAEGYRAKTVTSLGALGNLTLQETPFSVSVVPKELIENIQAQSADDIYKINPSTRTITAQNTGWSPAVSIRGFTSYDTAEDGLRRPYNHAAVLEDKERVEVLNGLSGFLYGAAAPGGMVNYVYKRPTSQRLNSVTIGNYGGSQQYVHGDFGGRIDEDGDLGYRLNVVKQDGNTAIDDQHISRELVTGALDWDLTDKLQLQLDASYNHYKTLTPSSYWYYELPRTSVPDTRKNWSQPWALDEVINNKLTGKINYQLSPAIGLRAAYTRSYLERPEQIHVMNDVSSNGYYTQLAFKSGATKSHYDAAQTMVDLAFDTGPLKHKMSLGYFMYADKDWNSTYFSSTGWQGPYSLDAPTRLSTPSFSDAPSSLYFASKVSNENIVIGDNIKLGSQWSVLAGVTHSTIKTQDFAEDGSRSQADYQRSRNSPSLSVVYMPLPWLSSYVSYIEGLELGGRAPDTANNAKEVMPAMLSRQKEWGIKANLKDVLLTGALFEIEKAYEYTNSENVYTQSGRQNHKGIEFTATGKIGRLTLLGGITVLSTNLKGGDYDGKKPINVAEHVAKLYAEYGLPITGLTLTGGMYYTGKQWADEGNTDRLPAYTTVDLGVRYAQMLAGKPLTLRLTINNVEDKRYWANSYYLGAPRTVAFSAQLLF